MWNNEYWVVTTTDGTKYYFGADHVPGDSVILADHELGLERAGVLPVVERSVLQLVERATRRGRTMPYRWNLDYVVDPDNNLTVYDYATETNYYMRGALGHRLGHADVLHP